MLASNIQKVKFEFKFNNRKFAFLIFVVSISKLWFWSLTIISIFELHDRFVVYHICNVMFAFFIIACVVASNLNMLIDFHFLNVHFDLRHWRSMIESKRIWSYKRRKMMSWLCELWAHWWSHDWTSHWWKFDRDQSLKMNVLIDYYNDMFFYFDILSSTLENWSDKLKLSSKETFLCFEKNNFQFFSSEKSKSYAKRLIDNQEIRFNFDFQFIARRALKLFVVHFLKLLCLSLIELAFSIVVIYDYFYLSCIIIIEIFEVKYDFFARNLWLTIELDNLIELFIFDMTSERIMKIKFVVEKMKSKCCLSSMIFDSWVILIDRKYSSNLKDCMKWWEALIDSSTRDWYDHLRSSWWENISLRVSFNSILRYFIRVVLILLHNRFSCFDFSRLYDLSSSNRCNYSSIDLFDCARRDRDFALMSSRSLSQVNLFKQSRRKI